MDWHQKKLYLRVLAEELEFAAYAFEELEDVSRSIDVDEMMRRAKAFLSHAAAASRLLWPQSGKGTKGKRRTERGRMLRETLGVPATHGLEIHKLRNVWEHVDEYLDECVDTFDFEQTMWQVVGGSSNDTNPLQVVRHYDPVNKTLTIFGHTHDLKALRASVQDVGIAVYSVLNHEFLARGGYPENTLGQFPHRRLRTVSSE
jgi:hypothetical protein